jgi:hypothetical protein
MQCLICNSREHTVLQCNSNRARSIDDAINHWLHHRLVQLYSSKECLSSIHWLALSHHFIRLSIGDLLYLNRFSMVGHARHSTLIYMLLYYKTYEFYNANRENSQYSIQSKKIMRIDVAYWHRLMTRTFTVEYAEEKRQTKLAETIYQTINTFDTHDTIDCPICLNETIHKKNTHQYNCNHSICSLCSEQLLHRCDRCPLCREQIRMITTFHL